MSYIDITLPTSSSTVSVKVLNITSPKSNIPAAVFLSPINPGFDRLTAPTHAFLIEHSSGRKILFDLGPRKDFTKLAPAVQGLLAHAEFDMSVDLDIAEQLKAGGVFLEEIDTVIWR